VFQATGYPCKRAQNKELCDLSELFLGTNSKEKAPSPQRPQQKCQNSMVALRIIKRKEMGQNKNAETESMQASSLVLEAARKRKNFKVANKLAENLCVLI
jgi:hypothetical protein